MTTGFSPDGQYTSSIFSELIIILLLSLLQRSHWDKILHLVVLVDRSGNMSDMLSRRYRV